MGVKSFRKVFPKFHNISLTLGTYSYTIVAAIMKVWLIKIVALRKQVDMSLYALSLGQLYKSLNVSISLKVKIQRRERLKISVILSTEEVAVYEYLQTFRHFDLAFALRFQCKTFVRYNHKINFFRSRNASLKRSQKLFKSKLQKAN